MASPADVDDDIKCMHEAWKLTGTLLGGTTAMRNAGKAYLPQFPKEEEEDYKRRLKVSVLFPGYSRTVATLSGKPFSKPVTLNEKFDEETKDWMTNVDGEGRNLHSFLGDCMTVAMGYGLGGILVDHPRRPEGATTKAADKALGMRPYWLLIKPHQILGYRTKTTGSHTEFTMLRYMEQVTEDDGEWGKTTVNQVRVWIKVDNIVGWATYRQDKASVWNMHDNAATTISEIPFVPFYGKRLGFMHAEPPLFEVAHLNVAHWQSASDQQNILHVARVPLLFMKGFDENATLSIGSSVAIRASMPDADMKYVEITGASIKAGSDDLEALEERMRQAGAELLVLDPRYTATQVATDNAVGMCALQKIVQDLQDAANRAIEFSLMWVNREAGESTVVIFNDFGSLTLAEASADLLLRSNQAGKLSDQTYLNELRRRGILGPDVDVTEELDRLQSQGPNLGDLNDGNNPAQ